MKSKITLSEIIAIVMLIMIVLVVTLMLLGPTLGRLVIPGGGF